MVPIRIRVRPPKARLNQALLIGLAVERESARARRAAHGNTVVTNISLARMLALHRARRRAVARPQARPLAGTSRRADREHGRWPHRGDRREKSSTR
jgi:hypothetical protein